MTQPTVTQGNKAFVLNGTDEAAKRIHYRAFVYVKPYQFTHLDVVLTAGDLQTLTVVDGVPFFEERRLTFSTQADRNRAIDAIARAFNVQSVG